MYQRLPALAGLVFLAACVTASRPKGGLEPVPYLTTKAVDQALRPKRLALLVGINAFADDRWPALKHARDDAESLGELLREPEQGCFDAVEVLSDAGGTELRRIYQALDNLTLQNASPDDTVVVYFSTHGTLARDPQGLLARYLVTTDTDQDRVRNTALPVSELLSRFGRLPSRRKVLVLASCHSGSGKSALPAPIASELDGIKGPFFVQPLEEISQASMVLTACAWGETAREDDQLGHDIYTHFFIEALKGKDDDGDGAVTASEAHAHARSRTYYYSQGRQRPQVESCVLGADPIVLSGRRRYPADPVLFSFLPRLEGMRVRVNGRDKGRLPARLVLTPGSHRVVVIDGQDRPAVMDTIVELQPGDQLAIEELIERRKPHWHFSARGGYQRFLDASTRSNLIGPAPLFGFSASRLKFPFEKLETELDLNLGGGSQPLEISGLSTDQGLLELSYGINLYYRIDLQPVVLLVGPRLAGLHLFRRGIPKSGDQHFFNLSPGLVAQVRWQFFSILSLDLEVRIHFLAVYTGTESLNLGYLDLFAGLGWYF